MGFVKLIPFLIAIVIIFALLQLYSAIVLLSQRSYAMGGLYLVFSFAGLALARALWTSRRRLR